MCLAKTILPSAEGNPERKEVIHVKYEKPEVVTLPDAIESVLAGSLMKTAPISDGPGSNHVTAAAYTSDED